MPLDETRPTIRQSTRRLTRGRLLLLLVLVLVVAIIAWRVIFPAGRQGRRTAGQPIPVLVAPVRQQNVPIYLDGLGTVQAFYTVTVTPQIDGPLVEVDFREGQNVHVGEVLARIDPRPYQATLDQAIAKKAQDEATLANARLDLVRYNKLAATAYTSAQTADTQRAMVAQDVAIVQQDQAAIDSARVQLSYTVIRSPIDGRTGIRQIDPGNIVHASSTTGIVVVTQLQPISLLFTLPQQDLQQVNAALARDKAQGGPTVLALPQGDPATAATVEATPLDTGHLDLVDNQVDTTTGTIKLKATFPNPKLALWPGGFVNARLLVNTEANAVTVPPVAIQRGPQGAFVFVLDPPEDGKQTVSRRAVTVGHEDLVVAVITAGLKPGEQVVVDGASRLTDHADVKVGDANPPAAPPAATTKPAETPARTHHRRTPG